MGMPEAYPVKQMKTKALFHLLHVGLWLFAAGTSAQAVTPGEFRSYATCHAIGLEWDVSDDADHDAVCAVTYKRQAAALWKEALPLYRVDFRADNMVAGSILFLTPDTSYDVRLRLSDPDGGDFSRDLVVHTRPLPEKPKNGRILYVAPGSSGAPGWKTDLDYDGFDWGGHLYGFKWDECYADLAAFSAATGLEPHGVEVDGARSAGKTVITPQRPGRNHPFPERAAP
jgi:hypothetical protein